MLLVHQVGSVRIGEVVRYTLTYTPSHDRILPSPSHLHVKIRNTSAIPLRAAYLHGPYTLYTACYPSTFDPNYRAEASYQDGCPEFEPNLKAGGSWTSRLTVPEDIRETAGKANVRRRTDGSTPSFSWVIEISSQVIFSTSATVHFELLVGRDEKSVELGFSSLTGQPVATPGQLQDHQQSRRSKTGHSNAQSKGVFSHALKLVVDDTESLWNKPALPEWDDEGKDRGKRKSYPDPGEQDVVPPSKDASRPGSSDTANEESSKKRKRKRVHLVVLTHGLHSNLGSDMLYLKESIDAAAKEARESARKRKAEERKQKGTKSFTERIETTNDDTQSKGDKPYSSTAPLSGGQDDLDPAAEVDEDEEEEVIVRGFAGNVVRTERGIQYLGKRLAKWILAMTYPDQPYKPEKKKSIPKKLSRVFTGDKQSDLQQGPSTHNNSSIHRPAKNPDDLAYKITSISFISHSLGGLTQTYAIAYIHKHSPDFFNNIKPINFVAMAAPFLGLSNENPFYIKFALDFGLVGRTGQDLGLSWRAPTMIRSGWGAMIGGIGTDAAKRAHAHPDPGSKPLLRILPTGHTHHVLKLFRNRTVYSNVVNDGIVPLRTSCLLFLDWSGLGRVEKARRENGVIGTMAGWGWSEINGVNKSSNRHLSTDQNSEAWSHSDVSGDEGQAEVPQPEENAVRDDTTAEGNDSQRDKILPNGEGKLLEDEDCDATKAKDSSPQQPANPLTSLLSFLRPSQPKQAKSQHHSPKHAKIYKRSQTTKGEAEDVPSMSSECSSRATSPGRRPGAVRGDSIMEDPEHNVFAPPKTTIFEAAGDVLNPPLPTREFLINPQGRPRTIFHDRVYHPADIPPPPTKKQRPSLKRSFSSESRNGPSRTNTIYDGQSNETPDMGGMKVEEKIARAYHHGLSWRKVLVRLEPDAHNNMVVRRMFSNAYGWPVIKHLVDTHFADTYAATTADVDESNEERAKPISQVVGKHGEEVDTGSRKEVKRTDSELKEANDSVSQLTDMGDSSMSSSTNRPNMTRKDSAQWDDSMFDITDDDDEDMDPTELRNRGHIAIPNNHAANHPSVDKHPYPSPDNDNNPQQGTSEAEIATFLTRSPPPPEDERRKFTPGGTSSSVGLGKSVEESLRRAGRARRRTLESQGSGDGSGLLADDITRVRIDDGAVS